ncbi:MAG: peptide-methionine (S)-S-oxide reductase MsrA [Burkholderiaceae bacterium]|nr:peptide-methionine (S)-S-oxide reductase MsrA [Burkholderiaceae bacterium]
MNRKNLLAKCIKLVSFAFAIGFSTFVSAQAPSAKPAPATTPTTAKATFAGGCFWCVESDFDKVPGVISTTSGYTGGKTINPSYEQVSSHTTGHAEAVEIVYDPSKVTYEKLLDYYWHSIDPTTKDQQFCDRGSPYRTVIFAHNEAQLKSALASKAALEKSKPFKDPIVTEIVLAGAFYPAEEYHQDYYKKNPVRYKFYRTSCRRDARLQEIWGDLASH